MGLLDPSFGCRRSVSYRHVGHVHVPQLVSARSSPAWMSPATSFIEPPGVTAQSLQLHFGSQLYLDAALSTIEIRPQLERAQWTVAPIDGERQARDHDR